MKLWAGIALFLLCALAGESRGRRLQRRAQALRKLHDLVHEIGERQLTALVSFGRGPCAARPRRNGSSSWTFRGAGDRPCPC